MLREDGLTKLLDFGLAKVALDLSATDETVAAVGPETTPGLVMGTTQYMSPEQARGRKVDTRSDIFSLGVVLYEMAAGKPPFNGETPSDLIAAILHYEPPPLESAPSELERILGKALDKDRDERYQTAKDLAVDLRRLRKQIDGSADAVRSSPGHGSPAWASTPKSGASHSTASAPARTAEQPAPRSNARRWAIAGALAAVVLIPLLWLAVNSWYKAQRKTTVATPVALDDMIVEKVSGLGDVSNPAMSDDGKLLAYVVTDAGERAIMLRQMATGSVVKIAGPTKNIINNLQFTPDGNFLYYAERTPAAPIRSSLMSIPVFGGTAKQILEGRYNRPAFSPDGKRFTTVRTTGKDTTLVIVNADGSGLNEVGTRPIVTNYTQATWSASGRQIAVAVNGLTETKQPMIQIQIMSAEAPATSRTVTLAGLLSLNWLTWSSDESALIGSAVAQSINAPPQLVSVRVADGQVERITKDFNAYPAFSLSRATRTIAAIQSESLGSIWIGPTDRPDDAKELPSRLANIDGRGGLTWVDDKRLAFVRETTFPSIWIMNADGTNATRLTDGAVDIFPVLHSDGQSLLFESDRGTPGSPEIFGVSLTDGRVRQITRENGAYAPSTSPDGLTLFFIDNARVPMSLKSMPLAGGTSTTVFESFALNRPRLSPDGKWIAIVQWESADAPRKVTVIPTGGGPLRVLATHNEPAFLAAWLPDSRSYVYTAAQGGQQNLWRVDLTGAPARQISHFTRGQLANPAISPDGKRIAFYRGNTETDIVLLKTKGQ
jgi:Tol biopolymer transport system component